MPSQSQTDQEHQATLDKLLEISNILDTGLDRETLDILKQLCDHGVNPQALAQVVKHLRTASATSS